MTVLHFLRTPFLICQEKIEICCQWSEIVDEGSEDVNVIMETVKCGFQCKLGELGAVPP